MVFPDKKLPILVSEKDANCQLKGQQGQMEVENNLLDR